MMHDTHCAVISFSQARINKYDIVLGDAKLIGGDVITQEIKYHPNWLMSLYTMECGYLNAQ